MSTTQDAATRDAASQDAITQDAATRDAATRDAAVPDAAFLDRQTTTRDAFLGGRVFVSQPMGGFRAGIDSVLLAAALGKNSTLIVELGAGAGVASICALADLTGASATLLDINAEMVDLAISNLAANAMSARASALCLDVTARGSQLVAAGLKRDHYTSVIANPPFFASGAGSLPPDQTRAKARHMPAGDLDLWVRTAATIAAPGAEVIFVHMASALPQLLASFSPRFGAITVLPVVARPTQSATRVLVRGIKGSRAPFCLRSPIVLHGAASNGFLPAMDAIFRGQSRLDW